MKYLCVLWIFCFSLPAFAIDREAFTFTHYNLDVRIEPEQHRLAVRGQIGLRNGSTTPQKTLALQVSSTLDWRSIQLDGKPVQFVEHEFTSDIDHTGALSEAIVTLPHEIPTKGTVELDIGYEGVILLDAKRLTRIGVPEDKAVHIDWDQISRSFTAVRGVGYVAWYPVATEAVNLSEPDSVSEVVGRWQSRQLQTPMTVAFQSTLDSPVFFSGEPNKPDNSGKTGGTAFSLAMDGINVPTFAMADYQKLPANDSIDVDFLPNQQDDAEVYGDLASQLNPITPVGGGAKTLTILALPDENALPFVTRHLFLAPLKSSMTNEAELDMVYALSRQLVSSPRLWIEEGLAHYSQAAFIEAQKGRPAALEYLNAHSATLVNLEKQGPIKPVSDWETKHALMNTPDDLYQQSKAMFVWWMLRDMLGNLPNQALRDYRVDEDKEPAYMQRLIEKETHRDLQWFFDDWVYHDRGLPDLHVESVFSRTVETGGFLVTITVENLGNAGAEVPVTLSYEGGEIRRRLEVRAKSKASVRIETPGAPQQVVVNDGSVPESDMTNNSYKVPAGSKSQQ